jgi:hypothetical protein
MVKTFSMSDSTLHLFWPDSIGPYQTDLNHLIKGLELADTAANCVEQVLQNFPNYPAKKGDELRFRAYLYVLRDLLRQEWQPLVRQGKLYLKAPAWTKKANDPDSIKHHKEYVRNSLDWERNLQFEQPSVRQFIQKMERPHVFGNKQVSIRDLIADGPTLAAKLQAITEQPESEQLEAIQQVVQPYLQQVITRRRCQFTDFFLQDIWRYFRYTWRTPYNATPGRQMFYLVRDAAQPFHPVIGIAALGSSLVQLTARDDIIGWTASGFEKRIEDEAFDDRTADFIVDTLRQTLSDALADIDICSLATASEVANPELAIINRLKQTEQKCREERIEWLKKKQRSQQQQGLMGAQLPLALPDLKIDPTLPAPEECTLKATAAMYQAKRAHALWQLLSARYVLLSTEESLRGADSLRAFWQLAEGNRAIRTLIRANKKRKVGINLMDIIVCGAVAPYNILLGGKLVTMLLAGPQVVSEYADKYRNYASKIASQLKGEAVIRDPQLVFLGTTSLYANSSSQYNRVRIPTQSGNELCLVNMGFTKGYGSIHFSADTRTHLDLLLAHTNAAQLINNRFGEGVNPKLRRVSAGLAAIGITAVDRFIKHRSKRIVYGLPLCTNSYPFLRGEADTPHYYFPIKSEDEIKNGTEFIVNFWRKRWLLPRITNSNFDQLSKVASFDRASFLLSVSEMQQEREND